MRSCDIGCQPGQIAFSECRHRLWVNTDMHDFFVKPAYKII